MVRKSFKEIANAIWSGGAANAMMGGKTAYASRIGSALTVKKAVLLNKNILFDLTNKICELYSLLKVKAHWGNKIVGLLHESLIKHI